MESVLNVVSELGTSPQEDSMGAQGLDGIASSPKISRDDARECLDPELVVEMEESTMSVRAKFKVNSITRSMGSKPFTEDDGKVVYKPAEMWSIQMFPVYGNGDPNHENTKFWAASPSGQLTLSTVNADAVAMFELDKEYYLDFTPAK